MPTERVAKRRVRETLRLTREAGQARCMNGRYGATVIVGCFILFGAATIVGGIRLAAG